MRLSADLYDLSTGEKVTQVAKEGGADDVLALTSALSVDLVRELLGASGQDMVQDVRLGALTTTSLPALRAYLEAEAIYRTADFAGAVAAYERAVELDSLFALAWLRLSNSYGWLDDIASPAAGRAGERALALVDRLPARDRMLVRASEATRTGAIDLYEDVRDGVRNYPDDPDLWFELGEFIYHVSLARGVASLPQAIEAFTKAVELDPGFGPYQVHLLELTIADGDRAAAEAGLARYEESTTDARNIEEFSLAIPLLLGSDEEAAQAITASLDIDVGAVERVRIAFVNRQDRYDRISDLLWTHRNRAGVDHQWLYYNLGAEGLLDRVARLTDSLDITVTSKALGAGWMLGSWRTANGIPQLRELTIPRNCLEPVRDDQCQMFVGWGLARSGDLAGARESLRLVRAHAAEAEGAAAATRTAFADVIEGTIAMEEGRIADARRVLAPNARRGGNTGLFARIQLGELEWEAGNVSEAITYLTSNLNGYTRPLATYTLARLYEERGDTDQARRHYRNFVTATARGDEDLPEIVEAREALARLGG
jgi:tetratricopeptide (TPR) repeat protein